MSPHWHNSKGGTSCVLFINEEGEAATPERSRPEKHLPYLVDFSWLRAPTGER
jgi:hypothetical protein